MAREEKEAGMNAPAARVSLDAPTSVTAISVAGLEFQARDGKVDVPEALAAEALAHLNALLAEGRRLAAKLKAEAAALEKRAHMPPAVRELEDALKKRGVL